ncbi:hypothetical protein FGADI_7095 [Fusarium gaditjirri]|uniref:Mannosylglycerate hydrolase MGH1-like glycoside hydrolase domain-containing protein n=1 Tax=Fusarium gaditjirri TaxID=282569 RepID=A0A8H4WW28_9HYPO|nr:hypothetical protein FGADI_7095 [Fusarium gaditjirri]
MSPSSGGTTILDRDLLLKGLEDQPWFEKNIPLLEIPDKQIQEVYYYRWQTSKEHLVYTGAQYGYVASEFLNPVSYGAPYGGIVAAAGHHITEGRWIRDTRYGQDIAKYWLAGPGFWAATALRKQYMVTGEKEFVGQLANLMKQYRGWDNHYSSSLGLYWQVPVWDATEYTAASYEPSDPYHGGAGFRPTINSYQYGDAIAIAKIAALCGDSELEQEYRSQAESLRIALQKHLWDSESSFYKYQARDDNPSDSLLGTREIMGYLPWMFDMPCDDSQLAAFSQLTNPRRILGQNYITAEDYYERLHRYARTQYRNWQPYVAEAHHPDDDRWIPNSKDYFGVDLRKDQAVDNVRLFFYHDSGGAQIPSTYDLQYWVDDAWVTIPGQIRSPMPTSSNAETKIVFPSILTSRLRVEAPNAGSGVGWGIASGTTDLKRKRLNSTASLAISLEPSVSFHVGSELRQTPQSSFLSYVWGTGLDSDCVSCGKCFLHDGEPPIRTIAAGNSNSQPSVIDITQEPVSPWNIRILNRHLSCIKANKANYIPISHAWHPTVATSQDLRLESIDASRLVYQIPSRTLLALTAKLPGCEVWHDYLSVPQWRPEVQERLLLLIPEIYNHAAKTVIHLDDVGATHLSGQFKDSPYAKFIVDLAAIIRSRWFDRMWVTLEYIQSNDVLILTEDYTIGDAYARDVCHHLDAAHSKWVKKRSNSTVTEDIWEQNTTLKRMTSWIDMEAWKNEHDMHRTLGWAIGILGQRKMLDFRPKQDPLVLIENRFEYFFYLAIYALQQGDYSPLLFIQSLGEDTDPRAPWLRGYSTATWKLWDMGRCHRKATSQPIIRDDKIQPKLQTVGVIETFEYYDFGGDAESVMDYVVSKVVRASGRDPQALCDATDRLFPWSEEKALNMEWKDAKHGDASGSVLRYDLDKIQGLLEKYGPLLDMGPGQEVTQQRLEIAKKMTVALKLNKKGKLARESRLELAAGEADWFLREYGTPMEGISQIRYVKRH